MFSSENLRKWQYESVLASDEDHTIGSMWKCPDFFNLDSNAVLICSPQDMSARGYEFHNAVYFVGNYDKENHVFDTGQTHQIDYELDFYAPQMTLLPDGRRVMVAWLKSWDNLSVPKGQKWQGMIALPRELSIKNGKLYQRPISELRNYFTNKVNYNGVVKGESVTIKGVEGRQIDLDIKLSGDDFESFAIDFGVSDSTYTRFLYNKKQGTL